MLTNGYKSHDMASIHTTSRKMPKTHPFPYSQLSGCDKLNSKTIMALKTFYYALKF